MEKKINVAELLRNCPKGMELDCALFETLEFDHIDEYNGYFPIICRAKTENGSFNIHSFTEYGCYSTINYSKCVIYPKGKTTWEGFQRPFKDGDIITCTNSMCSFVAIFKEQLSDKAFKRYAVLILDENHILKTNINTSDFIRPRFATEEEKQKLFDAIKAKGFKWNAETKTMEIAPEFKDGDIIYTKTKGYGNWLSIYKELDGRNIRTYVDIFFDKNMSCYCTLLSGNILCYKEDVIEQRLATEEEKQKLFDALKTNGYKWNAETKTMKKITAKFNVGDTITNTLRKDMGCCCASGKISEITDNKYIFTDGSFLFISNQDNWELVPNKFDITTLKAFDKVLARDCNGDKWNINLFGYYRDNGTYQCMTFTKNQCIPYDGNEHLLGTTDDCDEFYKTWK